ARLDFLLDDQAASVDPADVELVLGKAAFQALVEEIAAIASDADSLIAPAADLARSARCTWLFPSRWTNRITTIISDQWNCSSFLDHGSAMFPTPLKTFVHPHHAYKLEYPAHWDAVVEKDGESCGFGPHERDDVGLWISVLPMSVDTARLKDELPRM